MNPTPALQSVELINISINHHDQLNTLCEYVRDNFNIQHVVYTTILQNQRYCIMGSSVEYMRAYIETGLYTRCPFLNCDDKTSIPQVYMPFLNMDLHHPVLLEHKALCDTHHLYHPMTFSTFNTTIQETFTFFYATPSIQAINVYLNSINKLQSYVHAFKKNVSDIIALAKPVLPLSNTVFGEGHDACIFMNNKEYLKKIKTNDSINNSVEQLIKVIPTLTFREAQILQLYLEHRAAKEIARYTQLSARTVEKHIENFKKKIGSRKKEVILKAVNDLLSEHQERRFIS